MVRHTAVYMPVSVGGVAVHSEVAPYDMGSRLQAMVAELLAHSPVLQSLPDGRVQVRLRNIVLSQQGTLAYYELAGAYFISPQETRTLRSDVLTSKMLADAIASLPWKTDARYTLLHTDMSKHFFIIRGGKATFVE